MPRSGTTLAHQIIASHNKVVGAGEIFYLEQVIKKLLERHSLREVQQNKGKSV